MRTTASSCFRPRAGFSLLEIVLVLFVIGVLAAVLLPSARDLIERGQREAEMRSLAEIADTITRSFDETDLSGLNIAALPVSIGTSDTPTSFSNSTTAGYSTTQSSSWFAKVSRLRGLTPTVGVAPIPSLQPELAKIAFNANGNARLLFVGPSESGRQRFLLVSLASRAEQLALPAYESTTAWFDAIWNHDWENRAAGLPAYWSARLTSAQTAAWTQGTGGLTQVSKFCVRRIVLPKFTLTLNNNHPTEQAFASFNNTPAAFTAAANSGASVTSEILGGRLVIINRGAVWPGVEALRFRIRENATVTVQ